MVANAFDSQWKKLEEKIGIDQIVVLGNTILNKNIKKEKELSERDNKNCYLFCVSIDARWKNQGSGKHLTPILATSHIMVGNHTGFVVALHHMSKPCIKCEIGEKTGNENIHN
jgi:hypothetical protein